MFLMVVVMAMVVVPAGVSVRMAYFSVSRRRVPAKADAVLKPQRFLGGPDSLFATAAENGAKFCREMLQTRATAPQVQESLLFARISASEIRLEVGGDLLQAPCFSAKIESDLFLRRFSHPFFGCPRGSRKEG